MMLEQDSQRQRQYWRNRDPKPVVRNPLVEALCRRAPRPLPLPLSAEPRELARAWTLPECVSQDILRVCNNSDLSLYILLVTMFKAVAARFSGEAESTILAPSNRPNGVVSGANIVILQDHVQLSGDLRSNIMETRRTIVGAYSNQAITLSDIYGAETAKEILHHNPFCVSSNIHSLEISQRPGPLEVQFDRREREIACSITYHPVRLRADLVAVAQFFGWLSRSSPASPGRLEAPCCSPAMGQGTEPSDFGPLPIYRCRSGLGSC